jgi:hypothetical protein
VKEEQEQYKHMGHLQHDEWDRQHGDRSSKDAVGNEEGRNLIEFCERKEWKVWQGGKRTDIY